MIAKKLILLGAAVALPACSSGPVDATYNLELVPFEDLQMPWTGCEVDSETGELNNPNCRVSDPVIFRLDARVRDGDTLVPANNIRVWFTSPFNQIFLLPQEVLEAIEVPTTERWNDVLDRGEIWAEFSGNYEGDYRPTYHETWTDRRGMASVWVWVDSMPVDATGKALAADLQVSIASDIEVLKMATAQ